MLHQSPESLSQQADRRNARIHLWPICRPLCSKNNKKMATTWKTYFGEAPEAHSSDDDDYHDGKPTATATRRAGGTEVGRDQGSGPLAQSHITKQTTGAL